MERRASIHALRQEQLCVFVAVPGAHVMEQRECGKAQLQMSSKRNRGQIMWVLQDNGKDIVLSEMEI